MESIAPVPLKHKIVARNSPDHLNTVEETRSERPISAEAFGSDLIWLIKQGSDPSVLAETARTLQDDLKKAALNPSRLPYVVKLADDFIGEGLGESKTEVEVDLFSDKWGEFTDKIHGATSLIGKTEPAAILQAISSLDTEQITELIIFHNNNFEKSRKAFEEKAPAWKNEFIQKAQAAIDSGQLPITRQQLEDRISLTNLDLGDGLGSPTSTTDRYGTFEDSTETAVIFQQTLREATGKKTFFHELTHAISGRAINILEPGQRYEGAGDNQRIGLRFLYPGSSPARIGLHWLNEARTESLAAQIAEVGATAYPSERQLFSLLLTSGSQPLDQKLFDEAYIEDYDPSLAPADRVPKWKAMYAAVNQAYAPGFLLKLDQYIKAKDLERIKAMLQAKSNAERAKAAEQPGGVEQALAQIQQNWRVIQEFKLLPRAA